MHRVLAKHVWLPTPVQYDAIPKVRLMATWSYYTASEGQCQAPEAPGMVGHTASGSPA